MVDVKRELKRAKLMRNCTHEYADQAIQDPVDKRHKLRPAVVRIGGVQYIVQYCKHCGCATFCKTAVQ